MTAIARALTQTFSADRVDVEFLKIVALLCAAGLTAFFLAASYGLDLSAGFF
jgi:hypothetical protein